MNSVWEKTAKAGEARAPLVGDCETEALVIGGGMAGILTAHRLTQAGVRCLLVEAAQIGSGATKNTTAKITAQHGLIYADSIRRFGIEKARMYLAANARAIEAYRTLAQTISCDFEEAHARVYTVGDARKLEREAHAYEQLGLSAKICTTPELPFATAGALEMKAQAQFHPLKLLYELSNHLNIAEHTFVQGIEDGVAITKTGRIKAKYIVLATHFPLINVPGLYFLKMYQHRSYVLALRDARPLTAMYVDERADGHSFRRYEDLLLIGGGDHKTGKPGGKLEELRSLAHACYPDAQEAYAWAAQDCMALDAIPYIGKHRAGSENLYVATGFNKWGMTGAMVAAEVLTELITNGRSEWEALYSPQRSPMRLQLIKNIGGAAAGLFGIGGPRCTHMGCKLHWNSLEHTWDCSCHGSRFDEAGQVIDNPAKRNFRR